MINPITALMGWLTREDDNDRSHNRQEVARRNRQEAKLQHFAETGETDPPAKDRMEDLTRGGDVSTTAWLRELLAKYQFELHTSVDGHSVRLVDTKYREELENNTVPIDVVDMLSGDYKRWEATLRTARFNVRRRAVRAGLQKSYARRGNPNWCTEVHE